MDFWLKEIIHEVNSIMSLNKTVEINTHVQIES
jgi:hypothetical protein